MSLRLLAEWIKRLHEMPYLQTAVFVFCGCFILGGSVMADQRPLVRIGVLADKGVEAAEEEWEYVLDWLNHDVPSHRFVIVALDHPELRQAVRAGSIDFLITNAGNYSEFEYTDGVSRIATLDSPTALSPSLAVGSAVVVRADSGLTRLAQLKGKHVLAASRDAFCCYQIAARELVLAGVDPDKDLGRLEFVGFPIQAIVRAVRDGKADAGFVRTCLLEQMIGSGALAPGELRVLEPRDIQGYSCQTTSRLYPDWAFAALKGTSSDLSRKVAVSLLEMPPAPEGYRWTIPAHYAVLDELFRDLRLGRYANLEQETLEALAYRHRIGLMVAMFLLLGWLIHTVRVDYLVARRTRELQRAHREKESMAEAIRERQQALDHASRLAVLGGMASAIAHELKQPLAAIENFARGMERRIAAGRLAPEPLLDGCNEIAQQSRRAAETIERIRNFARKGESLRQTVDLHHLVREAVELFEVALPEANISWRSALGQAGATVKADPVQIQQVIFNLLQNAFDAQMSAGNAQAPIEVALEARAGGYDIGIRDQGGPLADEYAARLFEPFFTTKRNGLGLGLALSKWIVDAHGGALTLTREANGMYACLWLPEGRADE